MITKKMLYLLAASIWLGAGQVQAASYSFNILEGTRGALAVNNGGVVAGYTMRPLPSIPGALIQQPTLWSNRTITDLGTLGENTGGRATAINNAGVVVGYSSISGNLERHAAAWNNGAIQDLGTLGGLYSWANGINNEGLIVGYSSTADNSATHATLWNNGMISDLGTLALVYNQPNRGNSFANDISDNGQIVGWAETFGDSSTYATHATLWGNGTIRDLGTLGGANSYALAINNAKKIVGYSNTLDQTQHRATLWSDGNITDLGTLGGRDSRANAINDAGLIVGYSDTEDNLDTHATLWDGTSIIDLNSFLDASTISAGWFLENATDINDNGWITGWAYNRLTGRERPYLLSIPVQEPETYAMLIAGLGLLGFVGRRHKALSQS